MNPPAPKSRRCEEVEGATIVGRSEDDKSSDKSTIDNSETVNITLPFRPQDGQRLQCKFWDPDGKCIATGWIEVSREKTRLADPVLEEVLPIIGNDIFDMAEALSSSDDESSGPYDPEVEQAFAVPSRQQREAKKKQQRTARAVTKASEEVLKEIKSGLRTLPNRELRRLTRALTELQNARGHPVVLDPLPLIVVQEPVLPENLGEVTARFITACAVNDMARINHRLITNLSNEFDALERSDEGCTLKAKWLSMGIPTEVIGFHQLVEDMKLPGAELPYRCMTPEPVVPPEGMLPSTGLTPAVSAMYLGKVRSTTPDNIRPGILFSDVTVGIPIGLRESPVHATSLPEAGVAVQIELTMELFQLYLVINFIDPGPLDWAPEVENAFQEITDRPTPVLDEHGRTGQRLRSSAARLYGRGDWSHLLLRLEQLAQTLRRWDAPETEEYRGPNWAATALNKVMGDRWWLPITDQPQY